MSVLTRPDIRVEVAFQASPFTALDDPSLVWTDISAFVELDKGISNQRRRANELDEPSPGTLSLTLNNADGRFTRLNVSSPYYPYVKANRLIRLRAIWNPVTSVNLLTQQQATGGQVTLDTAGFGAPSGTVIADSASATSQGTPTDATYVILTDAAAASFLIGDILSRPATGTYHRITATSSAFGFTNLTVSPVFTSTVTTGETIRRQRIRWDTGNQAVTGTRLALGATTTDTAGPEAVRVTTGSSYTWSAYCMRGANSVSVSPRILWFDSAGAFLSETTGSTTALTTALQRLTLTATAPANAVLARPAVANETILNPVAAIAYRAGFTSTVSTPSSGVGITISSAVQAGDSMLLWVALDDENATASTPSGWTAVGNRQGVSSRTYLFRRVATSTDPGKAFTVSRSGTIAKTLAVLYCLSGTDTSNPVHQSNSSAEATYQATHVTPNVTTSVANCWIVSACFDRSSTTSAWTQPGGDTKRWTVFCTGSNAPTGVVSDNATPVAAGTYGTKTFTANRLSDDATLWTVAIRPGTTAGASTASIYLTGGQFEQAGSVSAWAVPAGIFTRFVGHIDQWPTAWEGGFRALTTITATDRMKALSDRKIRDPITEQVLFTSPVAYYPLAEDSGATAAGNASAISQPSIPIVTRGTVTDEMLEFGGGTGPGVDAQSALQLTPSSTTVGKALRGPLTTPVGGDGVTFIAIGVCFASTITSAGQRNLVGADDGAPTDGGAASLLDIYVTPDAPSISAHVRIASLDLIATDSGQVHDGHTHMAIATAELTGGDLLLTLHVDGVSVASNSAATTVTEFPLLPRWNIGCSVADAIQSLYSGTISHANAWNTDFTALSGTPVLDLFSAADDGFTGDLPGVRAQRLADWAALTTTSFETGVEALGPHPNDESSLLDSYRLIARSEGGVFLVDRSGNSVLQARSHRVNAVSAFGITADQIGKDVGWTEDPTLIANEVTVRWGGNEVQAPPDLTSQDDYGVVNPGDLDTILATDTQALDRGSAYVTRYGQPISRPDAISLEAAVMPELFALLLPREIGDRFTVTSLPTGAPAASVDLYFEGIGEEIDHERWTFQLDCSPASFDFGMILDDAARGLLDSNYLGW